MRNVDGMPGPVRRRRPQSGWVVPPTGSGALTVLLAVVLGLISLRAANPWLLLVGCALLAPVLVSQLLRPDLRSISICLRSGDRVGVGECIEQVFHAHNRGRRSSPGLRLTHAPEGFAAVTLLVPALPPGGRAELTVLRRATARGVSVIHDLQLQTVAPFGLAVHRRRLAVTARVSVHPAPVPVGAPVGGAAGSRVGGRPARAGDDAHELREWRRGDSLRQVHWRATARHDRLTVVIPEVTVRSRFALVVAGSPLDDDWEALLSSAAWTAVDAARRGSTVLLSAAGTPDLHGDDPGAVLDWFAALGPVLPPPPPLLAAAADWAAGSGSVMVAGTRSGLAARHPGPGVLLLGPTGRVSPP